MVHARHITTGRPVRVTAANGVITAVDDADDFPDLPWIAPAFFDPQVNGCLGVGFTDANLTEAGIRTVLAECRRHGVGAFAPTVITSAFETIVKAFTALATACDRDADLNRRLPAFHLEGPYISGETGHRGAHPAEHARNPDWDEFRRFQDAAGGRIRLLTLAPERPGAVEFIRLAAKSGVVVSIGHTAATSDELQAAADAGATASTHLGNGAHATLPRHPNVIWDQLADDRLTAGVIADGFHLPRSVLQTFLRAKPRGKLYLTADTGPLAGLPPGRYADWNQEFEVLPDGRIVVPGTPYLAGSGCFTDTCVANVRAMGVPIADAVAMATRVPRELLGLPVPAIAVGEPADWVLLPARPSGVSGAA